MHGHGADSGGEAASAQVAAPTMRRGTINLLAGPAAASAAASATEPTPTSADTRSECVSTRSLAAASSSSGTTTTRDAEFLRGRANAGFAILCIDRGDDIERAGVHLRARERCADSGFDVGRRSATLASDAGGDHGLTQIHWVTGIAGRHAVLLPTAPAREMAMRINSPPKAA